MSDAFPSALRRQRGVAGMMAMLFLLVVVGFSAVTLLNMSSSDLQDTTAQNDSVAALFVAEAGIERASRLYSAGTTCEALVPALPPGPLPLPVGFGRGRMVFTGVAPVLVAGSPDTCTRIQSRGVVGNTTRTIEVDLQRGPVFGDIVFHGPAQGSPQTNNTTTLVWNHGIAPAPGVGTSRAIIVAVAIRRTAAQTVQIGAQTTYNGQPMLFLHSVDDAVNGLRIEWLMARNPPIGGNPQIRVQLAPAARAVGVSMAFSGVDQVQPVDAISLPATGCTGNYPANPSCSVTTVTDKSRVVDMLAVRLTTTAATTIPGQQLARSFAAGVGNNGVRGAASYRLVSTSPVANVPMGWALTPGAPPGGPFTNGWLQSAVSLRPVPFLHIARWTEL